jgi:hypothetical protein
MLLGYPRVFRREYGHEMMLLFRNRAIDVVHSDGAWALLPFMVHIFSDWVTTVPFHKERTPMDLKTAARVSIVLGVGSILAVLVSHLALTDIYHGGEDLTVEWNVLRVCFGVIIAFQVAGLLTLRRFVRQASRGELQTGQ